MEGDAVPLVHILICFVELLQLVLRVVDEGAQLVPVRLGDGGGVQVVHLLLDDAGAGVQDVEKGLVLPVEVGDEVLRALGRFRMAWRLIISLLAACTVGYCWARSFK